MEVQIHTSEPKLGLIWTACHAQTLDPHFRAKACIKTSAPTHGVLADSPSSHPHFEAKAWICGSEQNLGSTLQSQSLDDNSRVDVRTLAVTGGPPHINTTSMLTPRRGSWVAGCSHGSLGNGPLLLAAGCWLLVAAGCCLLAAGCWWLLAAGCRVLAVGCWLQIAGRWLLAADCWLLAAGGRLLAAGGRLQHHQEAVKHICSNTA